MVDLATVVESNDHFANQHHSHQVCIFAGATAGIGYGTLRKMVTMLDSSTFYVLGRNQSKFAEQLQGLQSSGRNNKVIFIDCQVSLIASIDAVCKKIAAAESRIDYMCLSPGGFPFQGDVYTSEGLEESFAVSYYSRLRLIANLLPLINRSPHPRILSILNGSKEQRIDEDDLGLQKKWTIFRMIGQTTICTSLAFDHLAANDAKKHLTLIHVTPGLVNTGTPRTRGPAMTDGYLWWAFITFMKGLSRWIVYFVGLSLTESSERHAYYLTSDKYGRGSFRANQHNEIIPDNDALKYYKQNGWEEKIWEHTLRVWDDALANQTSKGNSP